MKPQLVIFDWAGTTVDYGCFAPVNAFALAFQKFGVNPTVEEIRAPMGMLKRDHIRTMLAMPAIQRQWQENQGAADEAAVEKIYGVFEDSLMESLADYAAPKPGVVETVEALRAQGIRIGSTTGYTDQMMAVVTQGAARQGYAPDAWFSPDSVQGLGRPYPYMIYANMAQFQIPSVADVVKVGDTVADIQEGKNAGILSLGVLEGSSVLGYTQEEYEALPPQDRERVLARAKETFLAAGADGVLLNLSQLPQWLEEQEKECLLPVQRPSRKGGPLSSNGGEYSLVALPPFSCASARPWPSKILPCGRKGEHPPVLSFSLAGAGSF